MNTVFDQSKTKLNLMKAFAGECQARTRYDMASSQTKQKLYVVSALFKFTANQEKEHAEIFYNHLSPCATQNICVDGTYPIDITTDAAKLLRMAAHNENEEHDAVYASFALDAREEGFAVIAQDFENIAKIEKTHAKKFEYFASLLEQGQLFVSDVMTKWMCLNCGYVLESREAPAVCPVCRHDRGYFIRLELSPWRKSEE